MDQLLPTAAYPALRLCVSDTGTGMTPEVIQRAFDPFFHDEADRHGHRLGLSMIYGFVRQSGGHAHIHSEPGQGTMVFLTCRNIMAGSRLRRRH